jgi:hypothetical protein
MPAPGFEISAIEVSNSGWKSHWESTMGANVWMIGWYRLMGVTFVTGTMSIVEAIETSPESTF